MRALLLALLLVPAAAGAEEFRVLLGERELGRLSFEAGETSRLSARFEGTPLGVADGSFEAASGPARAESGAVVTQYLSRSAFTRSSRAVSILLDGGAVQAVDVQPEAERTELSDAAAVPAGVVDLVAGFGRLLGAGGCPEPFSLYDGRRVARIATQSSEATEGGTLCRASYRVVAGPGMLSPLGLRSLDLDLLYGADGALAWMEAGAAGFTLRVAR